MTQLKINRAYTALAKLNNFSLPVEKALGVYHIYKAVEEQHNFAVAEETKYVNQYGGKLNPDGIIWFENSDNCAKFKEKIDDLNRMQVELNISPVLLTKEELNGQNIAPADIYSLEGLINFA